MSSLSRIAEIQVLSISLREIGNRKINSVSAEPCPFCQQSSVGEGENQESTTGFKALSARKKTSNNIVFHSDVGPAGGSPCPCVMH